jgi:hypothetical protein
VLRAYEESADVLPAIQRLVWLGNDNHTIVSAGIKLDQLTKAAGIPFLPAPGLVRIPKWIESLKQGKKIEGQTPLDLICRKVAEAESARRSAELGARAATRNKPEAERIASDMQAVVWVARFYRDKLKAVGARALFDTGIDPSENHSAWRRELRTSVDDFRQLTELTKRKYESLSDVPAWNPTNKLPCPYHWSDVLPIYERELSN